MRFEIDIKCPQCNAALSVPEDNYIFKCGFCDSTFHVTGTNEVLIYYLPAKLTRKEARIKVRAGLMKSKKTSARPSKTLLAYVPFWRLRAMFFDFAFFLEQIQKIQETKSKTYRTTEVEDAKEFRVQDMDVTFPADESSDFGLKSLSYRTEIKSLRLFDPRLTDDGAILPPTINAAKALKMARSGIYSKFGLKLEHTAFSEQRLISKVLSMIYYPIFVIKVDGIKGLTTLTVDGLSGRIMRPGSAADLIELAETNFVPERKVAAKTMGFILFRCPDCGWDLPYMPYNRVHVCEECKAAWYEKKGSFSRVRYDLVSPSDGCGGKLVFMPFWRLVVQIDVGDFKVKDVKGFRQILPYAFPLKDENPDRELCFYVPGFNIKPIKNFNELAARMTRFQPGIKIAKKEDLPKTRLAGVFTSPDDAFRMAKIIYLSLVPYKNKRARDYAEKAKIKLLGTTLTYFPFFDDRMYFRDPITGAFFQKKSVAFE